VIIVDSALQKRHESGNPVRVAMTGAGYMGRGIALQIERYMAGMRLVAIYSRNLSQAERAYREAGEAYSKAQTVGQLDEAIDRGLYSVTDNAHLLCEAEGIDAIIEATGDVEFGADVALKAIENRKHVILMNAELDATVGPILKVYADRAGVIVTNADGDQPGVMMNLFRFVKTIGYRPVLAGNIKGFQNHHRTPETQKAFSAQHGITPEMATSFADGTKISMENAVVANATGFRVGRRGMYGPRCSHVSESVAHFSLDKFSEGGLVDYILGAEPGPGVFVLGYNDEPVRRSYMKYFKMGEGPLYVFYTPYHLPHLEAPLTVARAVLFHDAAVTPMGGPVVDVITAAKRDLAPDEVLDGIGGYMCYGVAENSVDCLRENLLPMGLSKGCRMKRAVPKDAVLTYEDVELPRGRLCDRLRAEQNSHFRRAGAL